jgi:hypothetical protein
MGGTGGVVDAGAMRGVGGVVGSTWGAAEVVGVTRGAVVVGEAGDGGAMCSRGGSWTASLCSWAV